MKRTMEQWKNCDPQSMAEDQSEVAIMYAFQDAKSDILELNQKFEKVRRAYIKLTNCEQYGEDGEIRGHCCPNELLREFDDIFTA